MLRRVLTSPSSHPVTPGGRRDHAGRRNSPTSGSSQACSLSAPPSANSELRVNGTALHQPKPINPSKSSKPVDMIKKHSFGDLATVAALRILDAFPQAPELNRDSQPLNSADYDGAGRSDTPRPSDFSIRRPYGMANLRQDFRAERRRSQRVLEPPRNLHLNERTFFVTTSRTSLALPYPINDATPPPPPRRPDTPHPAYIESPESPSPGSRRVSVASQHLETLELDGEDTSYCPDPGPRTVDGSAQRWELAVEDPCFYPGPDPCPLQELAQRWEPDTEKMEAYQSLASVQEVQQVRRSTRRPSDFSIRRPRGLSYLRRKGWAERRVLKRRRNRRMMGRSIPTSATRSRSRSPCPRRQSVYEMSFLDGEGDSYCPSPSPSSGSIDWGPWAPYWPWRYEPNMGFTDSEMANIRTLAISPETITPDSTRFSSSLDLAATSPTIDNSQHSFLNHTPPPPPTTEAEMPITTLPEPFSQFVMPAPPPLQPSLPTPTTSLTWMIAGRNQRIVGQYRRSMDELLATTPGFDGEDRDDERNGVKMQASAVPLERTEFAEREGEDLYHTRPINPVRITPDYPRFSSPLDLVATSPTIDNSQHSFLNHTPPPTIDSPSPIPTLGEAISTSATPSPPRPEPSLPTLSASFIWIIGEDGLSVLIIEERNRKIDAQWRAQRRVVDELLRTIPRFDGETAGTEALAQEPEARTESSPAPSA